MGGSMAKKALIYGISGQDGTYLSEFLSAKGYEIAGADRKAPSSAERKKYRHYSADLSASPANFVSCIEDFQPDEIYNLAGISSHREVAENPEMVFSVNALAPVAMLSEISKMGKKPKFFQASTAYMFSGFSGRVDEATAPNPSGAYGISKLAAHQMVAQCRVQGLYCCSGILFNHESPRRTEDFVTKKIALAAAEISLGRRKNPLVLGSLSPMRDWGFAGDYVEAMWLMLQQKSPDDYVIATGESHSVKEFCEEAFSHVGLDWKKHVRSSPSLARGNEARLDANPAKARRALGWEPKVKFKELVRMMVDAELERLDMGEGNR